MSALERWLAYVQACGHTLEEAALWQPKGRLTRVTGMVMEAVGLRLPVGSACPCNSPAGMILLDNAFFPALAG